jgi:hypothetical protein
MLAIFDVQARRLQLSACPPQARIAFAAFWAQRLLPAYGRLHSITGFGDPGRVQQCLNQAWSAAAGESPDEAAVAECQAELVELAPELEVYPALGYAGMECAAAVWDSLATISDPDADRAGSTEDAFVRVIEFLLTNRDGRRQVVATRAVDPLGFRSDPIWRVHSDVHDRVMATLTRTPPNRLAESVRDLQSAAADEDVTNLVDSLAALAR